MPRQPRPQPRRGTLYLSVLGTATIVSIAGLCAMQVARTELRATVGTSETSDARLAAEAGVAHALERIDHHNNWRAHYDAGVREPDNKTYLVGDGAEFKFEITAGELDGGGLRELDAADADIITVRGIGIAGESTSVAEVTLMNNGPAYDCLDASVATEQDLVLGSSGFFQFGDNLQNDYVAYAGGDLESLSNESKVTGNAEAVGNITANVEGASDDNAAARDFPNPDAVFEYYKQRGTWIDINALPVSSGYRYIDKQALGPGHNPFGETNAEGIYVIDCQGARISISSSRVVGTIVLLNNANDSQIYYQTSWQPVADNFPALMVENGIELEYGSSLPLYEGTMNANFNPPGAPYNGEDDGDQDDSYPSEINGLIYCGGHLRTIGIDVVRVNGVIIAQSMQLDTDLDINYRSTFLDNPPPGFRDQSEEIILPGSWRRGEN